MKWLIVLAGLWGFSWPCAKAGDSLAIVAAGDRGQRMVSRDGGAFADFQPGEPGGREEEDLIDVCFGKGVFVAVGGTDRPRVVLTADGSEWEEIDPAEFEGVEGAAVCVLFGENFFHLMTAGGVLLRSGGGRDWEMAGRVPLAEDPKRPRARDMAFGNGVFMVTGDYGMIAVSSDGGRTWAMMTAPLHGSGPAGPSVEFGNGVFILAGTAGYTAVTRDGFAWEDETAHDGRFEEVSNLTWTGREFFACGKPADEGPFFRLMTRDGKIWTAYQPGRTNQPEKIWRFGDLYYGISAALDAGASRLFRSRNTREWEPVANSRGFSVRAMASNRPVPPANPLTLIPVERQMKW